MLIDKNHPDKTLTTIYDAVGNKISGVLKYDTETQRAEIMVYHSDGRPVTVTSVDEQGYLENRILTTEVKLTGSTYRIQSAPLTETIDEVLY